MVFSRWEKLWSRQRGKKPMAPPKSCQQIEWGNQLYQQGAFIPLLSGMGRGGAGEPGGMLPQNILKFQSPRTKECVFIQNM